MAESAPHDEPERGDARTNPSHAGGPEVPLTAVESFLAALVEAGPEVAEHLVRGAHELLLAAQALVVAAERRLAEQRRPRDVAEAAGGPPTADGGGAPGHGPTLRSVDDVA